MSAEWTPPCYQATVRHCQPPETWSLVLNRYQRDNLLWLLNACGYPFGDAVEPFNLANTGDWLGEIVNMLGKTCNNGDQRSSFAVDEGDRPNKSLGQLRRDVELWLERQEGRA